MRVLISGGGTGGHINPALAVGQKVRMEEPDGAVLFVGGKNSLESELIPKEGFEFKAVTAKFLRRKITLDNIKTLFASAKGVMESIKIIKEFKPDIVVGTGGYVSGPVVLAACIKKIPTLILEQNVYPGVTNRLLSRIADKVGISFEEAREYFPEKVRHKLFMAGNPVRKDILAADRIKSRARYNLRPEDVFIYSFGGSGGQLSLNEAIIDVIKQYNGHKNVKILHVTGKKLHDSFMEELNKSIKLHGNIEIKDYMYEAHLALSAADIVIGSAGAITIAEITAIGVPSILIPKTYTAENHQVYNARALEKEGAALVILEKDLTGRTLLKAIEEIIDNKGRLKTMALNSKRLGSSDVENKIYATMKALINAQK